VFIVLSLRLSHARALRRANRGDGSGGAIRHSPWLQPWGPTAITADNIGLRLAGGHACGKPPITRPLKSTSQFQSGRLAPVYRAAV